MKSVTNFLLLSVFALFINADSPVQNVLIIAKGYNVTIHGTSNLHNWDETVNTVTGKGTVSWNNDGSFNLEVINISMNVYSIKSDNHIMDTKTYKALKADENPEIILALISPIASIKDAASSNTISANCNLTIAGITKPVTIQVKVSMPQKSTMEFEGSQTIKMTDYGVDPPTALFGALKTGDDITINFKTSFTTPVN